MSTLNLSLEQIKSSEKQRKAATRISTTNSVAKHRRNTAPSLRIHSASIHGSLIFRACPPKNFGLFLQRRVYKTLQGWRPCGAQFTHKATHGTASWSSDTSSSRTATQILPREHHHLSFFKVTNEQSPPEVNISGKNPQNKGPSLDKKKNKVPTKESLFSNQRKIRLNYRTTYSYSICIY